MFQCHEIPRNTLIFVMEYEGCDTPLENYFLWIVDLGLLISLAILPSFEIVSTIGLEVDRGVFVRVKSLEW